MRGRTIVLPQGRILWNVPTRRQKQRAFELKERLDLILPSWCVDHCWVPGRGLRMAEAKLLLHPWWRYVDITHFFESIEQKRMWSVLRKHDKLLERDVRTFCDDLECEFGIPEGCACSPTLANLYLSAIDFRWQKESLRYGDNIASIDPSRYQSELLDIGLSSSRVPNFTKKGDTKAQVEGHERHDGGDETIE